MAKITSIFLHVHLTLSHALQGFLCTQPVDFTQYTYIQLLSAPAASEFNHGLYPWFNIVV